MAALFYAALELRFGIEARLHAYVDAALKARGLPTENSDYVASKLLKRLTKVEPHAQVGSIFTITEENVANPQSTPFFFTPVTRELAAAHGRLGELLHSKFFRNNPYWYLNRRPASIRDGRTLLQYRDFLNDVAQELESAIRGSLLTHPVFTRLVDEVVGEPDEVAP